MSGRSFITGIVRGLLTLVLASVAATAAWSAEYIQDVKLIGGTKEETDALKTSLVAVGWKVIDQNLNAGAGGDKIYLLYKSEERNDGFNDDYITDFLINNSSSYPDSFTYNGRTYYLVPYDGGEHFKKVKGDLNSNAGGADIHLYYTKDLFPDYRAVSSIYFDTHSTGGVGTAGSSSGYELNHYAGGDTIYMHITTAKADKHVAYIHYSNWGPICTNPLRVNLDYSLTQQIYHASEIEMAGEISAIAFYYTYRNNPNVPFSLEGVKIYMKHTDKSEFTDAEADFIPVSESDKVFEGSFSALGDGWIVIPLDKTFTYDGTSNLMVCCYDPTEGHLSDNHLFSVSQCQLFTELDYYSKNSAPSDPSNFEEKHVRNFRSNIKFYISPMGMPKPAALSVNQLTDTKATLSWERPFTDDNITRYLWQFKKAGDTVWSGEESTTGTSATLNNLTANTEYEFRVKALSGSVEGVFANLSFITDMALPYECGFENGMDRWVTINMDDYYRSWINYNYSYSGGCSFQFQDATTQYLISPRFAPSFPLMVSFYYNSGVSKTFQVGYSTSTDSIDAFTWGSVMTSKDGQWRKYEGTFPKETKYIAVKLIADDYQRFYLDDFYFEEQSSYAKPLNVIDDDLTDTQATLKWTAPDASVNSYAFQYRRKDKGTWSAVSTTTGTSVTLYNLSDDTYYDFRVKAIYSDGNSSNYVSRSFKTDIPMKCLPYVERSGVFYGWELVDCHKNTGASDFYEDNAYYLCFMFYPSSSPQYLISPHIDGSYGVQLSFSYKNDKEGSISYTAGFQVGYSTTNRDPSSFSWEPQVVSSHEWQRYLVSFPAGTRYISVKWNGGYNLYLDDFLFTSPQALTAHKVIFNGEERFVTSFYDDYQCYELPDGAVAYSAVKEGDDIVLVRIGDGDSRVIPSVTPVIIVVDKEPADKGDIKEISMTPLASTEVTVIIESCLRAHDKDTAVTDGKINGHTVYVLGIKDDVLGFYQYSGDSIPAGKVYILN